jgi:hypothetical protein
MDTPAPAHVRAITGLVILHRRLEEALEEVRADIEHVQFDEDSFRELCRQLDTLTHTVRTGTRGIFAAPTVALKG